MIVRLLFLTVVLCAGCGGAEKTPVPGRPAPVEDDPTGKQRPVTSNDGPHISRSAGTEGGIVVFWPRVIPKTDDVKIRSVAAQLRTKLVDLGKKAVGNKMDIRPEPERVCPRSGCEAATLGVLLAHSGGGCTAIALVSPPGTSPANLIPWAGRVDLKNKQVPFRDYPENQVTIRDSVPCDEIMSKLGAKEKELRAAIKAALK